MVSARLTTSLHWLCNRSRYAATNTYAHCSPHCTTPDYSNSAVNLSDIIGASLPCLVCKQLNLVIACWHLTSLPRVARDSPRRTLTRRAWQRQAQAPRLPLTTRWKPARTLCLAGRQRGTCGVRVGTHRRSGKSLLDECDWVQSHLSREYMALYIYCTYNPRQEYSHTYVPVGLFNYSISR